MRQLRSAEVGRQEAGRSERESAEAKFVAVRWPRVDEGRQAAGRPVRLGSAELRLGTRLQAARPALQLGLCR